MELNINQLENKLLGILSPRQREVLEKRFGLKDSKVMTLEALGKIYGVTRERVRQIEAGAIKELNFLIKEGVLTHFLSKVSEHLKNLGGVRRETLLLADLQMLLGESSSITFDNKIKFLLSLSGTVKYFTEDKEFYSYWYLDNQNKKKAVDFINKLIKFLENKKSTVVSQNNIDQVFTEAIKPSNFKDLVALNYLSISKKFHINQYGDFGLSHWPEINPKTVRDWAHLVLKKQNKPVHFMEIAKLINGVRGGAKVANPQTVHNELIKDSRFVLVGRGIYGLKDFGLIAGTTKEVMKRLLKEHGPMTPKELLALVLKERVLKKNTIFVNLQNRKHFKRLDNGRYTVNVA